MGFLGKIIRIALALCALAAIVWLVTRYMDKILELFEELKARVLRLIASRTDCCCDEDEDCFECSVDGCTEGM